MSTSEDISGGSFFKGPQYLANRWEVLALGLTTVIGGQYFGWNPAFDGGVGTFGIGQAVVSIAFICYIMCLAEMVSAMPLKGGTFAVGRVCLGFYGGYLVGALMLVECMLMTSQSASVVAFLYSADNSSLYWVTCVLFYLGSILIVSVGGRLFWYCNCALAAISTVMLYIYILGSLQYTNFDRYARYDPSVIVDDIVRSTARNPTQHGSDPWFLGGFENFFGDLTMAATVFAGIEILAMMPALMKNPKHDLPIAMIGSMLFLFVTDMFLLFVMASLPPGIAATAVAEYPTTWGFKKMLNINDRMAVDLIIPAQIAMAFGFIPAGARLIICFGEANLLPAVTKYTPVAVTIVCIASFIFSIVSYYDSTLYDNISNVALLAALCTYFNQLIGYIMFQGRYSSIERTFHSPLGVYGAYYALFVFLCVAISCIGLQEDNGFAIVFILVTTAIATIYYFSGPFRYQVITDEEFRMNVINANYRRSHGTIITRVAKQMGISEKTLVQYGLKSAKRSSSRGSRALESVSSAVATLMRRTSGIFPSSSKIQPFRSTSGREDIRDSRIEPENKENYDNNETTTTLSNGTFQSVLPTESSSLSPKSANLPGTGTGTSAASSSNTSNLSPNHSNMTNTNSTNTTTDTYLNHLQNRIRVLFSSPSKVNPSSTMAPSTTV